MNTVVALLAGLMSVAQPSSAPPATPSKPAAASQPAAPTPEEVHESLVREARALKPLAKTEAARSFLDAAGSLPRTPMRVVYRDRDRGVAVTEEQYEAMAEGKREGLTARVCDPRFFYYTAYGSPLMYARPLDVAAEHGFVPAGNRVLDFGYGSIGHLRMLASLGADVTGVEVEPVLAALYSGPGDTGEVAGVGGAPAGRLRLLLGQWPAQEGIVEAVAEGGEYDLFVSKNVLKRGYIHPAREADPRRLVHLGVSDAEYLKAVHDALRPGGLFLIYNLSPAQAPPDQPYLPHADGQCPFAKEEMEKAGFEVLAYDVVDTDAAIDYWMALGFSEGKTREEVAADLFAWYTLARRR
ncbi:MAG: hypothetical protein KF745_09080 [Phycisphaeraceae bacterium]|nr:hypothetical protein [Phycisphaeraceae bacterium]